METIFLITKTTYFKADGVWQTMPINIDEDYKAFAEQWDAIKEFEKMVNEDIDKNGGNVEHICHGATNICKVVHGASYTIYCEFTKEIQ